MTALFVYCHLVTLRCVGGTSVWLLRADTVLHCSGQRNVMQEFKHTHYFNVESGTHQCISIDIYRDNCDRVSFEGGEVIVTLVKKT